MTCAIVLNSKSGTAQDPEKLAAALARAAFQADVLDLQAMTGTGLERAAERYDVLVAAGGDGTVSTVAAAASAAGRTFGVIPSGTLNHFARDAGIPADLDDAIAIITRGRTRAMDVGDINGRIFVNNASIGAYPRMVWERNRARGLGLPRPIAMAFAVARTWSGLRSLAVRIVVDGQVLVRKTPFIFIGNSEYDVTGTDVGSRPTMTDGKLSLYMAPRFGRRDALLLPLRVLRDTLESHERFEAMTASTISIETARKQVGVARDGEVGTFAPPLQFSVRRHALKVLVP
ncbi:MAG: sphingosine kinase [Acidobacteriota bacterium]|nr:sphingosine kinase [Acidobacteriota bacterium]